MTLPFLLIPGLNCTAEVYQHQVPVLWQFGPVTVANHLAGRTISEIASSILAKAPPRFAMVGFSMGGYIAFEILRQARDRALGLALLDTSARPDAPDATEKRRAAIALAEQGKFGLAVQQTFPNAVHPDNRGDRALRSLHTRMAEATGPETYIRQQNAIIGRADSRGDLGMVACPTLVVVGEADAITVPEAAREMAAGIVGADLLVVPGAGHMALVERSAVVNDGLVRWAGKLQRI